MTNAHPSTDPVAYVWTGDGMERAIEGDRRLWYPAETVTALRERLSAAVERLEYEYSFRDECTGTSEESMAELRAVIEACKEPR